MDALSWTFGIAATAVLCGALPWAVACLAIPALEASERAHAANYRGDDVVLGLGAVWLVWSGGALLAGWLLQDLGAPPAASELLPVAGLLALAASAFGLFDDAYGSRDARGFAGHLRALRSGRLTTGGLKLVGIGVAALAAARSVAGVAPWGPSPVGVAVAGAAVALSANFVNLLDLRPGRALKAYLVLAAAGSALAGAFVARASASSGPGAAALLGVALAGPAIACWRYDLGERAMLGDAGANAMGAVAGLVIVSALPLAGAAVFAGILLVANLASERVSFSALIERVPALAWFDGLGRPRSHGRVEPGPHAGSASRYDGSDITGGGSRED